MFLPTGDTPNPRNFTPWVNWSLIVANVLVYVLVSLPLSQQGVDPRDPLLPAYLEVMAPRLPYGVSARQFLAQLSQYDLYIFAHGYKPGAPEWSDLFFSLFLHGGLLHLFGNMLFLWIYGDNCEHRLGRLTYLLVYLFTGVVATEFFAFFAGNSLVPLVGASGAISGVLGLYFLLFPRNQVKVFVFLFPLIMDVVLLPARLVLGIYLVIDNLLPFFVGAQSNVAYGAHIGGFLGGLVVAYWGERIGWSRPWARAAQEGAFETPWEPSSEPVLAQLRMAIRLGQPRRAIALAGRVQDLAVLEPDECVVLAGWMEEAGYSSGATRLLRARLSRSRRRSERADLYLELGLMRLRQGQETAAYQHLLHALEEAPDTRTADRAREALARIQLYRKRR